MGELIWGVDVALRQLWGLAGVRTVGRLVFVLLRARVRDASNMAVVFGRERLDCLAFGEHSMFMGSMCLSSCCSAVRAVGAAGGGAEAGGVGEGEAECGTARGGRATVTGTRGALGGFSRGVRVFFTGVLVLLAGLFLGVILLFLGVVDCFFFLLERAGERTRDGVVSQRCVCRSFSMGEPRSGGDGGLV